MMRAELLEILRLQNEYSAANTPAMQKRGELIRKALPDDLLQLRVPINRCVGNGIDDINAEGRDSTGNKAAVPWVRLYSQRLSPSAQNGWYCVYLFKQDAAGVYLCLAHGSTSLQNGSFVAREPGQVRALLRWAHSILARDLQGIPDVLTQIDLGDGPSTVAHAYEASTLAAVYYPANAVPDEAQLQSDLFSFMSLLGKIYGEQDRGRTPGDIPPDVREAESEIASAINPATIPAPRGQGIGLSPVERRAVERHAMATARAKLEADGYLVEDHSSHFSYDLLAIGRDGQRSKIEVKGTTGGLGAILLTANEVRLHLSGENNGLFVVHSINLERRPGQEPIACGGAVFRAQPWLLDERLLTPIAYQYKIPIL